MFIHSLKLFPKAISRETKPLTEIEITSAKESISNTEFDQVINRIFNSPIDTFIVEKEEDDADNALSSMLSTMLSFGAGREYVIHLAERPTASNLTVPIKFLENRSIQEVIEFINQESGITNRIKKVSDLRQLNLLLKDEEEALVLAADAPKVNFNQIHQKAAGLENLKDINFTFGGFDHHQVSESSESAKEGYFLNNPTKLSVGTMLLESEELPPTIQKFLAGKEEALRDLSHLISLVIATDYTNGNKYPVFDYQKNRQIKALEDFIFQAANKPWINELLSKSSDPEIRGLCKKIKNFKPENLESLTKEAHEIFSKIAREYYQEVDNHLRSLIITQPFSIGSRDLHPKIQNLLIQDNLAYAKASDPETKKELLRNSQGGKFLFNKLFERLKADLNSSKQEVTALILNEDFFEEARLPKIKSLPSSLNQAYRQVALEVSLELKQERKKFVDRVFSFLRINQKKKDFVLLAKKPSKAGTLPSFDIRFGANNQGYDQFVKNFLQRLGTSKKLENVHCQSNKGLGCEILGIPYKIMIVGKPGAFFMIIEPEKNQNKQALTNINLTQINQGIENAVKQAAKSYDQSEAKELNPDYSTQTA